MAWNRPDPTLTLGLVTLVALAAVSPERSAAQHPFTPGVAFGATVFPDVDRASSRHIWALQFDLFTELSKDLDLPGTDFQKYNDIDRTIGVNQVGFTTISHIRLGTGTWFWHRVFWVAGGIVWDGPTEFLQNDFAHGLRLLTYVPREGTVDHVAVGVGTDQTVSVGTQLTPKLDVLGAAGVGGGLSTTYFDGYGQLGGELGVGGGQPWLKLGVLGRLGRVGDPFYWEGFRDGIDGWYQLVQPWVQLATPIVRIRPAFTRSWGPWVQFGGSPDKVENLVSVRIESGNGDVGVEMWNDAGFKDLGPTFGLRIQWTRSP